MCHLAKLLPLLALAFTGAPSTAGTGTLVPAGPMSRARAAHTATSLPDGRVLVAGGFTGEETAPDGAEVYDPVSARFTLTGPMQTPRHSHTATPLPDGRVLLAGGYGVGGVYLSRAEIYCPTTGTFAPAGALRTARAGHVAVRLPDDRVLLVGGVGTGWTFLASALRGGRDDRASPQARRRAAPGRARARHGWQ
jgi:hypothetical protein